MTKLGTPIGAGPKGAIVVLGLAPVGAPPVANWEPPSVPSAGGWTPAVAGGALTPPAAVVAPRLSLCLTPPSDSVTASPALRPTPLCTLAPVCDFSSLAGVFASAEASFSTSASSLVSEADSQSGSSRSTSPSLSSSTSFAQAGVCAEGSAGVVVKPLVAWLSLRPAEGSAPAMPTPSAVTTANPARAMISASFCLMRRRLYSLRARVGAYPYPPSPQA
jgi:hypothetical protein